MLTYGIYAVIVAALLVLLPMAVMEWWDLWERWGSRRRMRGYRAERKAEPGCGPPPKKLDKRLEVLRTAEVFRPRKEGD